MMDDFKRRGPMTEIISRLGTLESFMKEAKRLWGLGGGVGSSTQKYPCQGRLTLTSATPITTADVTAAGTLYFTPFDGDQIALFNGVSWDQLTFTEISISLNGITSGKNYDVFIYNNAGTPTIELLVWTTDTARATAITTQNGVRCKTGALTRRYVGTIRASAANVSEDSKAKRFVVNYYNTVLKACGADGTAVHNYVGGWRSFNNDNTIRAQFISLFGEVSYVINFGGSQNPAAGELAQRLSYGIDVNNNSTDSGFQVIIATAGANMQAYAPNISRLITVGFHFIQLVQNATANSAYANYAITVPVPC